MKLARFSRPELWNWRAIDQLQNELSRLFEAPLGELSLRSETLNVWAPALDLYEDSNNLVVQAELPGLKKEEIDIALHNGVLTISGERKTEAEAKQVEVSRSERFYGRFQRSITLPKPVSAEAVKATYVDGILTVTLAKSEEAKPRQIKVSN